MAESGTSSPSVDQESPGGSQIQVQSKENNSHHHHQDHHIHFVDPQSYDQGDSRIHFLADDLNAHDSRILVEPVSETTLNVRLGFLQVRHVYEVRFPIEDQLGEDVLFNPLENIHAKIDSANPSEDERKATFIHRIIMLHLVLRKWTSSWRKNQTLSVAWTGKGHDIVLTFSAMKEKIMQESITIKSKNDSTKQVTLILHARVLGKGKGTPSLKKGIHCVRIEWDEESDASDWQGF